MKPRRLCADQPIFLRLRTKRPRDGRRYLIFSRGRQIVVGVVEVVGVDAAAFAEVTIEPIPVKSEAEDVSRSNTNDIPYLLVCYARL
ncbi:hypothetical protein MB901379_04489 [Mycobacterium basiliense]|uniref:Uncharacterized protein n=1 Tax=Mycobacterium basiliense TaxID=2094119 RepID=A0A3S4BJ87_9MYCO|nr:hypothetical protein [Mycobacterium basiliense]VDM90880.1 hypothetical protein MB901379_04489 [Mycobacterium basiliense]